MFNSLLNQLHDILTVYCNSYFTKKITINISKPHLYTVLAILPYSLNNSDTHFPYSLCFASQPYLIQ